MARRDEQRRTLAKLALAAWFAAMVFVCAVLLGRHLVALPSPATRDVALTKGMARLRSPQEAGRLMAVHVLYASCRCSVRIADHLVASRRPRDTSEHVLLVGSGAELADKLRAHGFRVDNVEPDALAEYGIGAVPLLVVVGGDGGIRYAGGYTTRKQGPDPRDISIIESARADTAVEALPVFGCAVAERLRERLDPTGLF